MKILHRFDWVLFIVLVFVFVLLATVNPPPAFSNPMGVHCEPREKIANTLALKHQEFVTARGLTEGGLMIEVFSNPNTESWTLILTSPDKTACVGNIGGAWFQLKPPRP